MEKLLKSDPQTLKQGTPKSPRRQGMCPHKGSQNKEASPQRQQKSEGTKERTQDVESKQLKLPIKNTEADKAVLYKRSMWNASFKSVISNILKNNVYAQK